MRSMSLLYQVPVAQACYYEKVSRKYFILVVFMIFSLAGIPADAQTNSEPQAGEANVLDHLLITEVQIAGLDSASDEFIEIYNPSNIPVEIDGWYVEKAASVVDEPADWKQLFALGEIIAESPGTQQDVPEEDLDLDTTENPVEDDSEDHEAAYLEPYSHILICSDTIVLDGCTGRYSQNLASSGGHLRITRPGLDTEDISDYIVVDLLGWGSANQPETAPAVEPGAGESLHRSSKENSTATDDEAEITNTEHVPEMVYQDTDDNSSDFGAIDTPSPGDFAPLPQPADGNSSQGNEVDDSQIPVSQPGDAVYANLIINELLPDPVKPQTDADDEYIELYNPSNEPVVLSGYVIQTGSSLQYQYEIPSGTIAAKGYKVFYARDTGLVLSNSGSRAQVLAPDQTISAPLVVYDDSKTGKSWSRFDTSYAWSDRLTPGSANLTHTTETSSASSTNTESSAAVAKSYPKLTVTEVFPDPESPQKDADDEFIEIYNPNSFPVDLEGYRAKSGSTLRSSANLDGLVVQPRSYIAVFNRDVSMSLTNAGGLVVLEDPNGDEIFRVQAYPKALPGQSWSLINGTWQWTARPTPAAKNIAASSTPSKTTPTTGSSGEDSAVSGVLGTLSTPAALPDSPPNWRLISAIGAAAAIYLLFESRYDIRNLIYRYRRHLEVRRSAGK